MAVTPFPVDNSVPEEEEVLWEVCCLRTNRAGGPVGMRAEHLRAWLGAATREESPDPVFWDKSVGLTQAAFCKGRLTEYCT